MTGHPIPSLLAVSWLLCAVYGCGGSAAGGSPSSENESTTPIGTGRATSPVVTQPPGHEDHGNAPACRVTSTLVRVVTGRPSYTVGQPIVFRVSARNHSRRTCNVPTGSCIPQLIITAANGPIAWNRASSGALCTLGRPITLRPGHVAHAAVRWTGRRCAGSAPTNCPDNPAPPGTYHIAARWLGDGTGTSTLLITQ